jgi:hypothetical protein
MKYLKHKKFEIFKHETEMNFKASTLMFNRKLFLDVEQNLS